MIVALQQAKLTLFQMYGITYFSLYIFHMFIFVL